MAHKKEIYTTVVKILPGSVCLIEKGTEVGELNRLCAAFYYLFNSDTLTKTDYVHIFEVLVEKFPIYQRSGDSEKYKASAIAYAEYGYPSNPDIARVIGDFIDHIHEIPIFRLQKAMRIIQGKVIHATPFVGVETHEKGFTLTPLTAEELANIKNIILV